MTAYVVNFVYIYYISLQSHLNHWNYEDYNINTLKKENYQS